MPPPLPPGSGTLIAELVGVSGGMHAPPSPIGDMYYSGNIIVPPLPRAQIYRWDHRAANFPPGSVPPAVTQVAPPGVGSEKCPFVYVGGVNDEDSPPSPYPAHSAGCYLDPDSGLGGQMHLRTVDTFPNCPAGTWAYDIYALVRAQEDLLHAPRAFFSFSNGGTSVIHLQPNTKGKYILGGSGLPTGLEFAPPKYPGTNKYVWKIITCHVAHLNQRIYQGVTLKVAKTASLASIQVINSLYVGSMPQLSPAGSLGREILYLRAFRNATSHSDAVREANVYSISDGDILGPELYGLSAAANGGEELFR